MRHRRDPLLHYLERPSRRRLERVVRAYHDHVWKVAFRVAGHAEDAQDICQDVFLGLLLEPPAASEVRSPGGYLAWCVVGRAGKLRRAAERRAAREREAAGRMVGHEVSADDAEALRAELARLPDELRLPLELRYLAGLGNAEVASALGLPARTLEQRLHDGRERLRRRLAPLLLGPPLGLGLSAEPAPAAPPALLPALLQVVRRGGALSSTPAALAVLTGGAVVTKKTVAVAGALAILLLASTVGSIAILRTISGNRLEPDEVAAPLPAGTEAGDTAAADSAPVALVGDNTPELPPEPPRASLHGVVKDEEGAVLPGVTVVFRDNVPVDHAAKLKTLGYRDVPEGEWGLETTTDASGEFHFDGLLPGEARAGARGPGLGRTGSDFELEAGKTTWQTLFMRYLRRLHGRVSTSDGAALRGAAVLVRHHAVGVEHLPRAGDEDHEFVLFPVDENGQFDTGHCLQRFPEGGSTLVAWADGHAMNLQGKPRVSGNPYVASVDFVLEPEMPLEVSVTDPSGSPLDGVEIGLGNAEGTWGWVPYPLCFTDAAGRARLDHLERKPETLRLAKAGFHPMKLALKDDGPREITVVLQPEATGADLTVRLVYEEPFPALVQLWGELILERQAANEAFEPVSEKGRSSLDHRVPQVVFRPAESGRFRCRLVYRSGGEGVGEAFDHDVRQPAAVDLDVALPGPYVAGVLVDAATGSAVPGRGVMAYYHPKGNPPLARSNGTGFGNLWFPFPADLSRGCETDASGGFLMLLPRDECPLEVSVRVDKVRVGWARAEPLEVGADDRVTGLRLELRPGGTIHGKVVDASGAPVAGETIAAYDGGANLDRKTSDADGTFRFAGLAPGAYAVEALGVIGSEVAHGGVDEVFGEGVLDPAEVFERRVAVHEGETTAWTIVLERDRLGAIEGFLGEDLPSAGTVEHQVLVDGQPWEAKGWPGSANVQGRAFRIPNRHAGLYRVTFTGEGVAAEATAEVRRGHVARVVLRRASGTLSIPLPALAPRELEGLEVAAVQRRGRAAPAVEGYHEPWLWEEWSAFRSEVRDGAIVIAGLPGGTWRARVKSPHLPDAWSEPAPVQDGLHAEAATLEFPKPPEGS